MSLQLRGINYDTGTNYMPGYLSREVWNETVIRRDIQAIRDDLHCNAINIYGSDVGRLQECATFALQSGLHVWLQPRLIDSQPEAMLTHLSAVAQIAEPLRQHGSVTLNIGCELSVFMSGLIPRPGFLQRAAWLGRFWWLWMLLPRYNDRLNRHLGQAVEVARSHFAGQITYGSGIWERIDWTPFDLIGLNYYRESSNQSTYLADLRQFYRFDKPVVITEFGCCCFDGADRLGGSGDSIVDYTRPTPVLKGRHRRNEQVQADTLRDLLDLYMRENLHGAFVFEFTEPSHPFSPDPGHDLDMASYGIVKVFPHAPETLDSERWEPKQAFHEVARIYGSLNS